MADKITETAEKRKWNRESFREALRILEFVRPYRGTFALGMFFLVLSAVLSLGFPYVLGKLVDSIRGKDFWLFQNRTQITLFLLAILVFQGITSFMRVVLFTRVSQKSMRDLRVSVFSKIICLPMSFFESRRVGELTSRITADVQQLQEIFSFYLAEFLRQFTTILVGIPVILFLSPRLALFMLAIFPPLVVGAAVFGRYIRKLSRRQQDELADANVVAEESLQNISVVKSFTNEWFEIGRYTRDMDMLVKTGIRTGIIRGSFFSFIILGLFGAIVLVIWYGLGLVERNDGSLEVGELISFIIFTIFIGGAVGGLGDVLGQIQKSLGASERLREVLRETQEVLKPVRVSMEKGKKRMEGDIVFSEVVFSYPTRKEIQTLKGVSFHVRRGETVAIAGPSGAGKTTISQLLQRFFPIDAGEIRIDGKPVGDYDISELRSHIGVVPQDVILFGGTIRENIEYGRPGAREEEIIEAAKRANAMQFISTFPEGLNTVVGERGIKLSGGQRQRIAIARAILKDPAILILDEATSSLDSESERLVQEALDKLMKDRTTIVIAHRLATIRNADKILVIDGGRIAEAGTFTELSLVPDGLFRHLLSLQQSQSAQSRHAAEDTDDR